MQSNVAMLYGTIAAPPEYREFASGARYLRYLITTRTDTPRRRVDVLPVIYWDPPPSLQENAGAPGQSVEVVASVQRRFWEAQDGRRSRVELVARSIEFQETTATTPD